MHTPRLVFVLTRPLTGASEAGAHAQWMASLRNIKAGLEEQA